MDILSCGKFPVSKKNSANMTKQFTGLYLKADKISCPPSHDILDATYRAYLCSFLYSHIKDKILLPQVAFPTHFSLITNQRMLNFPPAIRLKMFSTKDLLEEMKRICFFHLSQMEVKDKVELLDFFFNPTPLWNLNDAGNFNRRKFAIVCDSNRFVPLALLDESLDIRTLAQFIYQIEHP